MNGLASRARWAVAGAAVTAALLLLVQTALARPPIRKAFFNDYPSAVGSRLDNLPNHATHCGVCHYDFNGGGPRNLFGQQVEAAIPNYSTFEAAILSLDGNDSDGDGYTNHQEILDLVSFSNTPTFPGLQISNFSAVSNVGPDDITPYLTPVAAGDVTPPTVVVSSPNGGEMWTGGSGVSVTWSAADAGGVASVDVYFRDGETNPWQPIGLNLANSGTMTWFVRNTPTTHARVRVVARDIASNVGADSSNATFTILPQPGGIVPTTLRDFEQPGTQPLEAGTFQDHTACFTCHAGYDSAVEPGHNWQGSMMAQAARDPLFYACASIAEQDAPSAGDLCIRCHSPFGWLEGRSTPTDASQLTASDRDGVACDFCHRAVDPIYKAGISPTEDAAVLGAMVPSHVPTSYANGQFVIDPNPRKRGPFNVAFGGHGTLQSAFHRTADFCGTCHDVSNPVFERTGPADYAPGPLDQPASVIASDVLMPLERTYSEWKNSSYPAGVYAPDLAGNKADGVVAICQDCHLRDVSGKGCTDASVSIRPDLPLHDMTGGNAWLPTVIPGLYPTETDATAGADGKTRAISTLSKAATLAVTRTVEAGSLTVAVTVTNRTGHKLPTGYPEGRRMWIHLVAKDAAGTTLYESGAYDATTGTLAMDPPPVVYETHLGLSPALAAAIGEPAGESFHFALNDTIYKDNRIPPLGFTNAAFATFGGAPVDADHEGPAPRYADGQNWDTSTFRVPAEATQIRVELMYQTTSTDYVTFLRDQNTTNAHGQDLYDTWVASGRSAPVVMTTDSLVVTGVDVAEGSPAPAAPRVLQNPFKGEMAMRIDLAQPADVRLDVFDARGRRVSTKKFGTLGPGPHRIDWNGRTVGGGEAGAGVYWARVHVGDRTWVRQVVRVK
ncbi:MAG: FlgD immunoglobulin-like domain containing protein [Hyphomicrobiales bacterium]